MQLTTRFITDLAVTTDKLAANAVTGAKIESSVALAGAPTTSTAAAGDNSTKIATTAYVEKAVENALTGLDLQADVLDIQTDATLDPGVSPTVGDRYIIEDAASLHANFGTIDKDWDGNALVLADDDIVEYHGSEFRIKHDVSAEGEGTLVWDQDSNTWNSYNGSAWSEFGGLAGVTAGDGLDKSGDTMSVDLHATNPGLEIFENKLRAKTDESSIERAAGGLQVKALGITNAMLAGSIADSKLSTITTANKVSGSAVQLAANGGLEDSTGLKIKLDGATLVLGAGGVKVGTGTIGETELNNADGAVDADSFVLPTGYSAGAGTVAAADTINEAIQKLDGNIAAISVPTEAKESNTLDGTDITNQYIDLAQVALANSISLQPVGGMVQEEGVDYTVNLTGGAGGNTRITFAGDLATGGDAALIATDKLLIKYRY